MIRSIFRKYRFVVFLWIFIYPLILLLLLYTTIDQHDRYWEATITRVQTVDFNIIHAMAPYAISFLEEHNCQNYIKDILNSNYGFFAMVYTDLQGKEYKTKPSRNNFIINSNTFTDNRFSYIYKKPLPQQCIAKSPYDDSAFRPTENIPAPQADFFGKLYLQRTATPSFLDTLLDKGNWARAIPGSPPISDYFQNIVTNLAIIFIFIPIVFAVITYYYRKWKVAEYNRNVEIIKGKSKIVKVLKKDIKKNKKLLADTEKQKEAAKKDRSIWEQIAKDYETRYNESISSSEKLIEEEEAEKGISVEAIQQGLFNNKRVDKPMLKWLRNNYKNLSFSKRAIRNILDIIDMTNIYPTLPDSFSFINMIILADLLTRDKTPPKSISYYTDKLNYFNGMMWEYRFSQDGRIFFGQSRTRTWNIDTILLKSRMCTDKQKYDQYLVNTLGKDNNDLK